MDGWLEVAGMLEEEAEEVLEIAGGGIRLAKGELPVSGCDW